MVRATWNGAVLAESDDCIRIEGNQYFPVGSVNQRYLQPSSSGTECAWKGVASYYDTVETEQSWFGRFCSILGVS
jgi:uncharacterized protein (DUF427 family)